MPFQIIRNDITKVKADAIVNPANPEAAIGDGVDSAIYQAAGKEQLLAARREIGSLAPGEVGITPAYHLNAKYIIHASGIRWKGGDQNEIEILRQCYDRSLELASEYQCQSIAFPLLATGSYGYPKKLGIQIAVDAFTEFLKRKETDITLVVFGSESVHISGTLVDEVRSYIDDVYEKSTLSREYRSVAFRSVPSGEPLKQERKPSISDFLHSFTARKGLKSSQADSSAPMQMPEEESRNLFEEAYEEEHNDVAFFDEEPIDKIQDEKNQNHEASVAAAIPGGWGTTETYKPSMESANQKQNDSDRFLGMQSPQAAQAVRAAVPQNESLDHILKGIYTDSFEKHLQQIINKKGLKNSEVYAAANISKQYFSKLLKGQVKPSKEKVLALAVGLRLNMDETVDFLRIAGYALSPISQTDAVVKYFIAHEDYNVLKIDIVLFDYGLDPLSSGS